MSYDIAVFDPQVAPREREAFLGWYYDQTDWRPDIDYNSPEMARSEGLRLWLKAMFTDFPPMNGPFARRENAYGEIARWVRIRLERSQTRLLGWARES
jgi:hypothetical protein